MRKSTVLLVVLCLMVLLISVGIGKAQPRAQETPAPTPAALQPESADADCPETPLQSDPFTQEQPGLREVPWVKAEPESSGITAHLFYLLPDAGPLVNGGKVLWMTTNSAARGTIQISGKQLVTGDTYEGSFPEASCGLTCFPSGVTLSVPGCWQFDLKIGDVSGRVTLWADLPIHYHCDGKSCSPLN